MFFRFAAALVLIVLVSMTSVFVEKRTLELRRQISVQYYQTDVMIEMQVQLRLEAQRLLAPALSNPSPDSAAVARKSSIPPNSDTPAIDDPDTDRRSSSSRLPLLRFQQPFRPEGID